MADDGTPLGTEAAPAAAVLCLRCGYDLRGLPGDGACPECGLAVGRSWQGQRELHRGRPGWVGRLRAGVWLLLAVQLGLLGVMFAGLWAVRGPDTPAVGLAVLAVFLLGHATALWLLTGRENQFERRQPGNWVRVAVRLAIAGDLWIAACVAKLAFWWRPGSGWAFYGLAVGFALLGVTWGMTFVHLRRLAKRVLDDPLAEHCLIVAVGLPLAVAGPFMAAWFEVDVGHSPGLLALLAVLVGLFLFLMWSALLLGWFGVAFGRAAREARATWAAADGAA